MYNDQINGSNENYLKIMMKFARQKENLQSTVSKRPHFENEYI